MRPKDLGDSIEVKFLDAVEVRVSGQDTRTSVRFFWKRSEFEVDAARMALLGAKRATARKE